MLKPDYLVSADGLTRVFLEGEGPTVATRGLPASNRLSYDISIAEGAKGRPAQEGLQMTNVRMRPVTITSGGPFDQIAQQAYTATINGQPDHGLFEEFLDTRTGDSVFLQSISTSAVTSSAGVASIIQSIESDSHPS